jgi:hypothetical protein
MTYRTFEPSAENHEGVDYRWVHENDKHNELGFGVPDPASSTLITSAEYYNRCLQAAELAEIFLGDKVSDRTLLAQARDFLQLEPQALGRSLDRFNRTEHVYTAEPEPEPEPKKEEVKEEPKKASEKVFEPKVAAEAPKEEPKKEEPKAEEPKKEEPKACAAAEPKKEEPKKAAEKPVISKERAVNLAKLATRTLPADQCTRENVVERAKKLASMNDEQLALALVAAGEQPVLAQGPSAVPPEQAKTPEAQGPYSVVKAEPEPEVPAAPAPVVPAVPPVPAPLPEPVKGASVDLAAFEFNTGLDEGDAFAASDPELEGLFGDPITDMQRLAGIMPQDEKSVLQEASEAIVASSQGEQPRVKVASAKVGVKSVGSAVTPPAAPVHAAADEDLSSLWRDAPDVNAFFSGNV